MLTQPYDKISPSMQARYLAASPHNLVRIILGQTHADDNPTNNLYTRGAEYFQEWIRDGVLKQDAVPAFYAYFQDFRVPDSGELLTRQGFIGLGQVEDYSAQVVYRHEQTLSGPKKDRLEVLRHTRAHFGQIFMLYPDQTSAVDDKLAQATADEPALDLIDEYGARHRLWAITDPDRIERIQKLMAPMKLLIADGHHRYETALNYRDEHPDDRAAQNVMMTFVNMHSPGLKILATHRVLRNLSFFKEADFLQHVRAPWAAEKTESAAALKEALATPKAQIIQIGLATKRSFWLLHRPRRTDEMDVTVLHHEILHGWLGLSEADVREEKHIHYVRGIDAALKDVDQGDSQIAFLLEPTPIDAMAKIAFDGGVMPQKSTDFYPKLLTGATIYTL